MRILLSWQQIEQIGRVSCVYYIIYTHTDIQSPGSPNCQQYAIHHVLVHAVTGLQTPTSPTPTSELTTSVSTQPTEIPFYMEAAFIVGMVILAIALLFVSCAAFLCCIRPRHKHLEGDKVLQVSRSFQLDATMPSKKLSPERVPVTGSWSPNEYTVSNCFCKSTMHNSVYYFN